MAKDTKTEEAQVPAPKSVMLEQINDATNTFKAYKVDLHQDAEGWSVIAYNGRIGGTLTPQPKIAGADFAKALAIFNKTVATKRKGGYDFAGGADVEMIAVAAGARDVDTSMVPMRPTALDIEDIATLDPEDMAQEKHDGECRPVKVGADILTTNRQGQIVPVRKDVADQILVLREEFGELHLDAEDMGKDGFVFFDIRSGARVTHTTSFIGRNMALAAIDAFIVRRGLDLLRCDVAVPLKDMIASGRIEALRAEGAEGIVVKRGHDVYAPGKANSVGKASSIKLKFTEDATFRVAPSREEGVRSVGLESYVPATGEWVARGNVTIPANVQIPEVGSLIDVTYLHISGPGGSPNQPVFKKVRTDALPEDCDVAKLKLRRAARPAAEIAGNAPSP